MKASQAPKDALISGIGAVDDTIGHLSECTQATSSGFSGLCLLMPKLNAPRPDKLFVIGAGSLPGFHLAALLPLVEVPEA
jgi:hypothetical protein